MVEKCCQSIFWVVSSEKDCIHCDLPFQTEFIAQRDTYIKQIYTLLHCYIVQYIWIWIMDQWRRKNQACEYDTSLISIHLVLQTVNWAAYNTWPWQQQRCQCNSILWFQNVSKILHTETGELWWTAEISCLLQNSTSFLWKCGSCSTFSSEAGVAFPPGQEALQGLKAREIFNSICLKDSINRTWVTSTYQL